MLKKAIILEDARRIKRDEPLINNIRRLAIEMATTYGGRYDEGQLYKKLWQANRIGYTTRVDIEDMDQIINDLTTVLHIERDELLTEWK